MVRRNPPDRSANSGKPARPRKPQIRDRHRAEVNPPDPLPPGIPPSERMGADTRLVRFDRFRRNGMPARPDYPSGNRNYSTTGNAAPPRQPGADLPDRSHNHYRAKAANAPTQLQPPAQNDGRGRRSRSRPPRRELPREMFSPPPPRAMSEKSRPRSRVVSPVLYGTRLLILGIGVGVIAGTFLSVWDPASRFMAGASSQGETTRDASMISQPNAAKSNSTSTSLKLLQEIAPLKSKVQAMAEQQTGLTPVMMFADLDTGAYLDINGNTSVSAASTIKIPVLVAFFQDVDAGKIRLDEMLTMRPELIASEAGEMQYQPPGTQFSALETATKMIIISDNTATNMLIDRLGGIEALNQRFQSWGLTSTAIRNPLPDLQGTNTTSPKDMALLMTQISQGDLVSLRSRDYMLSIMKRTVTDTLLPRGLGQGAMIAHKTGDIGSVVGDVGIIDVPNGKRYVAAILVKRPFNDNRAQELIRQISRITYLQFSQPTSNSSPAAPSVVPSTALPQMNTIGNLAN